MCGPSIFAVLLLPLLSQSSDGLSTASPANLPTLTTVAAIRQLTAEEARRGYPVRIRGVITFKVPSLLYVQDETGGIYVDPDNTPPSTKRLPPGTLLEVEGVTTFLRFSPTVRGSQGGPVQLKVLGHAPLPAPLRLSLVDDFHVERPSPGEPYQLPVRPIASLMHFDAERMVSQRVRVQAIVTQVMAGQGMYVQGEDAGILVNTVAPLAWVVVLRYRVAVQTQIIRRQLARQAVYEERGRIARELHDTLEQALGGLSFHLHAVDKNLPHSPQSAQQVLGVARSLLEYSRAEARRSIADLRASLLEDGDLTAALKTVAVQAQVGSTTVVEAVVEGEPRRLPGRVETNLLRIAQEALTNALKHGKPSRVELKLSFDQEDVTLRIIDDGAGFEVEQTAAADGGHFGLLGMRERAEKIQGCFAIHSAAGHGTEIVVVVKLKGDLAP
ncbi:MAG: sensor histidine kinase [Thermoguttaceae bacterium]|jgi:signal transduction histidine kinase